MCTPVGRLSREEFHEAYHKFFSDTTDAELNEIFDRFDTTLDGAVQPIATFRSLHLQTGGVAALRVLGTAAPKAESLGTVTHGLSHSLAVQIDYVEWTNTWVVEDIWNLCRRCKAKGPLTSSLLDADELALMKVP